MTTGDSQPTLPLPGWAVPAGSDGAPRRRRRVWPWIVSILVLVGLALAGFFFAEAFVRDLLVKSVRDQIAARTGIDADAVEVGIPGLVLPQLAGGTIDRVTIAAEDVRFESFQGDVVVEARGIPVRGDADLSDASATVTLEEEQVRALMSRIEGFPVESLGLDAPNVTMSTELNVFGVVFPIGVALRPSVADGQMVFRPDAFQLAGVDISAQGLRDQFGLVADLVLRDWTMCVAEHVPAGISLTDVTIQGRTLVAEFDIAPGILHDETLRANGTCS